MTVSLDRVFHALADKTRRSMVKRLAKVSSCTVTELAKPYDLSFAAVSKHVKVLEDAGVVKKTRDGRTQRCRLDVRPLDQASRNIDKYRDLWRKKLYALELYLERQSKGKSGGTKR